MPFLCSVRCFNGPFGVGVGCTGTEQQSHKRDHGLFKNLTLVLDTSLRLEGALLWNVGRAQKN